MGRYTASSQTNPQNSLRQAGMALCWVEGGGGRGDGRGGVEGGRGEVGDKSEKKCLTDCCPTDCVPRRRTEGDYKSVLVPFCWVLGSVRRIQ